MEDKNDEKRCVQLQVEDYLLPGIPHEITLTKITPKLSWRDLYALSSVNRAWNSAIRSRQVYNENLRCGSTVTLFLSYDLADTVTFYSVGEKEWYALPPLPDLCFDINEGRVRLPLGSRCVSTNGKIYVLGGQINFETWSGVFVFDVAAGGKWEQCASMKDTRKTFACAVKDGKIYVFGGQSTKEILSPTDTRTNLWSLNSAEVYDPDKNAWSPIKAMPCSRSCSLSFTLVLEDEIFVQIDGFLATYHPMKDEWRVVQYLATWERQMSFLAEGKLSFVARGKAYAIKQSYKPTEFHIFAAENVHDKLWAFCLSSSFEDLLPAQYVIDDIETIFFVENKFLAIVAWTKGGYEQGHSLLRSRRYCTRRANEISEKIQDVACEDRHLVWEVQDLAFAVPYFGYTRRNYFVVEL